MDTIISTPSPDGSFGIPNDAMPALVNSFTMIIVSEIGDKTFLIAAILAMRHPRLVVFAGAFLSLFVMSILSAAMGHILPTLIPKRWTQIAAGGLFLVFGAKMLMEARGMEAGNAKIQEEMREAEEEIEGDDAGHDGTGGVAANGDTIPLEEIESGGRAHAHTRSPSHSQGAAAAKGWTEGARNFCSFFLGPVFVQAFILTFLGEWGDRSQIATIALGAAHVRCLAFVLSAAEGGADCFFASTECLPSHGGDRLWALAVHCISGRWGPIHLYKDISQTR